MQNGDQLPIVDNQPAPPAVQNTPIAAPTHVLVSKVRYGFLRRLEERAIPENPAERQALLHGELKTMKTQLKEDISAHKGRPFLLALCLLAFITLLVISELYGNNKNHNKDESSTEYGIGVASLAGTFLMAIMTYIVKRQEARDEQHLAEIKDSRETLKRIGSP